MPANRKISRSPALKKPSKTPAKPPKPTPASAFIDTPALPNISKSQKPSSPNFISKSRFSLDNRSYAPFRISRKSSQNRRKKISPRFTEISEKTGAFGDPGGIRTHGLSLRRRPLYPAELRDQIKEYQGFSEVFVVSNFNFLFIKLPLCSSIFDPFASAASEDF